MLTHMKTTIELSNALFREAKKHAAQKGISFRELVETGLKMAIGLAKSSPKKFKLKNGSVGGKGLAPGLEWGDWETIRDMIYEGRGT